MHELTQHALRWPTFAVQGSLAGEASHIRAVTHSVQAGHKQQGWCTASKGAPCSTDRCCPAVALSLCSEEVLAAASPLLAVGQSHAGAGAWLSPCSRAIEAKQCRGDRPQVQQHSKKVCSKIACSSCIKGMMNDKLPPLRSQRRSSHFGASIF